MPDQDSTKKLSVLIVEDEVAVAKSIRIRFERMSRGQATVKIAETLTKAIEILEANDHFDLILWDGEPASPVTETVKVIARFRHKAQVHVAMSGRDDVQDELMKPGLCNESAMKPIPINDWLRDFLASRYPTERKR